VCTNQAAARVHAWCVAEKIAVLNVAGSRESGAPGIAASVRDVEVDGVSLEACGQFGIVHTGHHEKTFYSPQEQRLLSVCCCDACRSAWSSPDGVVASLRSGQLVPEVLEARHAATDALRAEVLSAVPPGVRVTLHGHPDPWMTGSSPGLTPAAASCVDAVLVPVWPTDSSDLVTLVPHADAYLSVLPPGDPEDVIDHARRLVSGGAKRLSFYHLGLAGYDRQPLFSRIVSALTEGRP